MPDSGLPSFRKPPVVETVLGVQFDPLPGFSNAHLGAFWKYWQQCSQPTDTGDQWKSVSEVPPIAHVVERFGEQPGWLPEGMTIRMGSGQPPCRLQVRNLRGDAMIQLQNDRLHYNWIAQPGQPHSYPRYTNVRPAFDRVYKALRAFLSNEGLGEPRPDQWEVTYVNHIPKGALWKGPSDWPGLIEGVGESRWIPPDLEMESTSQSWHLEIKPRRGRLHIDFKHAKTDSDQDSELLRLTLTARGPAGPQQDGPESFLDGLDLGRRTIVLAFARMTPKSAQESWERTS